MGFEPPTGGWTRGWRRIPRVVRFVVVGGVNTVFGYLAYASFVWLGFHYAAAALLGTIAGIAFNYVTTRTLVFDARGSAASVFPFVAVYAVVYAVNVAALRLCIQAGMSAYMAGLVLVCPMAIVTFVLMRSFVFPAPHAAD